MSEDNESVGALLENLGRQSKKTDAYRVIEAMASDTELELKFQALEALSEMERPRTVRACVAVLRIYK